MNNQLKERLFKFLQTCDNYRGRKIIIKEFITTNKDNYNRHFTTFSELEFTLQSCGARISGGRAMFLGDKLSYEIAIDIIVDLIEIDELNFELVEKYSESVYRKSELRFE
ncbi:hypothetical protein [Chondrinema litorale]|uniref:hypothetical protein n=1 Tax=Chondrinema litorale TaxID=2994555 RepID=UPI0025428913|nr:hypothetical protein [Chondrinema litorale]UZR95251.1 hypothetical protein OQ292_05385 [Chondrinema litorale]